MADTASKCSIRRLSYVKLARWFTRPISDHMPLSEFHDVVRAILSLERRVGQTSFAFTVKKFNSFHRKTRSEAYHEFKLHQQEKCEGACGAAPQTLRQQPSH
jgi:hypothetical protein